MHSRKHRHASEPTSNDSLLRPTTTIPPEVEPADEAPERFLRLPTVLARTGLSRSTLYRKVAAGTFPRQIRISKRCIAWSERAVSAWQRDAPLVELDRTV